MLDDDIGAEKVNWLDNLDAAYMKNINDSYRHYQIKRKGPSSYFDENSKFGRDSSQQNDL